MKRDDEIFDGRIREFLDSYEEAPEADVWGKIERELDRRRFRAVMRKTAYYSAAAALVAGLFIGVLFYNPYDDGSMGNAPEAITAQVAEEDTVATETGSFNILAEAVLPEDTEKADITGIQVAAPALGNADAAVTEAEEAEPEPEPQCTEPSAVAMDAEESERTEKPEDWTDGRTAAYGSYGGVYGSYTTKPAEAVRKKKSSLSISASGLLSPTNVSGNVDFTQPNYSLGGSGTTGSQGITPVYGIRHYFPVSAGLELKYSFLNDRLGVGLGVNYTFLISSYEALVNFGKPFQGTVEQSIHYIGVPLNFYVNILSGNRLSFYANAGCMVERAVRISYEITDLYSAKYRKSVNPSGVQWSANVGIGLEYRFFDFMGLYVDPRLTYFFDCGQPYSVRAEQPLQFNLELGFRFHI